MISIFDLSPTHMAGAGVLRRLPPDKRKEKSSLAKVGGGPD